VKLFNLIFLLGVTFSSINSFAHYTATYDVAIKYGADFSLISEGTGCALTDEQKVHCWGEKISSPPRLINPTQVAVASDGDFACALDDSGVQCWGDSSFGQTKVPKLANPTELAVGDSHSCVIDSSVMKCWGYGFFGQTSPPQFTRPTKMALGYSHGCVLDALGVHCWDYYHHKNKGWYKVPKLSKVNQFVVPSSYYASDDSCGLDEEGIRCWGWRGGGETSTLPRTTQLVAGGKHFCALNASGVKCWGIDNYPDAPQLSNPEYIVAGNDVTCALDDSGVVCWGDGADKSSLSSRLSRYLNGFYSEFDIYSLETSFLELSDDIYLYKSNFFKSAANILKNYPLEKNESLSIENEAVLARLFILNAVSPVMHDISSPYMEEKVLPKYKKATNELNQKLGISGFYELDLNETTLDVSLSLIRYALESTRAYIGTEDNTEQLETLILKIGGLSADTLSLSEKLDPFNKALSQSKPLISTLVDNPRTHGFGVMISAIGQYLEKKGSER